LQNFGLELQKKIGIRYKSPSMPVELTMTNCVGFGNPSMMSMGAPSNVAAPLSPQPRGRTMTEDYDSVAGLFATNTP
jgi:hypothetical protein